MVKNRDEKMMDALAKFQKGVTEIMHLWESTDGSGVTEFDEILEKGYPFDKDFFEMYHKISNWTSNSTRELINRNDK